MNSPCPICGSQKSVPFARAEDIEYFSTAAVYQYYQCSHCRVLFIFPVPSDMLETIYPTNYYSYQEKDGGLAYMIKRYLDGLFYKNLVSRLKGTSLKVLDIGGGTGGQIDVLLRVGGQFTGKVIVDLDEAGGLHAREKGYTFFHGRFEDFQTDDRFDLILAINILEHVADPLGFLRKAAALLSAQGILVIKTPNYASLDCRLFKSGTWGGYHCPRHWVIFDGPSLLAAVGMTDLKCTQLRYTQGAPFWAVSALNVARKLGFVRVDRSHPAYTHPFYKVGLIFFAGIDLVRGYFFKTSQMVLLLQRNFN